MSLAEMSDTDLMTALNTPALNPQAQQLQPYMNHPNVRNFLGIISKAEGTDKNSYQTAFGGGVIDSLKDHPRKLHDFTQTDGTKNKTSAAGKYQMLQSTWDDVAGKLGLKDFGPESQDMGAIELMRRNGSLDDVLKGDYQAAIKKSGSTWASLPSSPYAQPKRSAGFMEGLVNAIVPSAQAQTMPDYSKLSDAEIMSQLGQQQPQNSPGVNSDISIISDADLMKMIGGGGQSAVPKQKVSTNPLVGAAAGIGHGVGEVAMGAQHYLGKGLNMLGAEQAGNWLVNDAKQGRDRMALETQPYKEASPFSTGAGELAGNVAATWPVGGLLGKAIGATVPAISKIAPAVSPYAQQLASAITSGGMNLGGRAAVTAGQGAANLGIRALGGAINGGATAGLVNPEDVGTGAMIGAAFPMAATGIATGAQAIGRALRGGEIAQPVKDLALRANQLGIDIPADRIANSKPMNALASSLNYVPMSGRAATETKMQEQLNRAVSRTFGQDSDNVTMALRQASGDLGAKFDTVLSSNTVKVDAPFVDALKTASQRATSELEKGQAKIIKNQIDEILSKSINGEIDGQAAYNIKKTLDRLGRQNTPQAFYANELKKDLMGALNRSLTPEDASAFATVRQQYGNMLSLENLAKNGVDGDISIARLANMRNINNKDLQELADISAQFLKPREGQHGAMQRVAMGVLGASVGSGNPGMLAAGLAGGRGANALLNSNMIKNAMMGAPAPNTALSNALKQAMPVSAKFMPVLSAQ